MGLGVVAQNALGLQLEMQEVVRVTNRCGATALAIGDVVYFDLAQGDAAVNNNNAGAADSGFANVIEPPATVNSNAGVGLFAVVVDLLSGAGADNTDVLVCYRGRCQVAADGALTSGSVYPASVTAANRDLESGLAAVDQKRIAIALETGGGAGLHDCLFDGINGFGSDGGT